jgi:hypothetical protein
VRNRRRSLRRTSRHLSRTTTTVGENGRRDVTVHAPTAHGVLSALHQTAPDGEVTADDIIGYQKALLAASNARVQELELALNTVTNLSGCAMKFMVDKGYGDDDAPNTISFSKFFLDSMKDCGMTIREDFAGGYVVTFRERAEGHIAREG